MAENEHGRSITLRRGRPTPVKRLLLMIAAFGIDAVVPMFSSSQPVVSAATEIDWYVAVPGYVRTNLQPTHLAAFPGENVFYAITNGDTSRSTLMMISLDDFSVLEETPIVGQGPVNDVEVSAAGAVYVLTASSVSRFSASDLSLVRRIAIRPGDPTTKLTVAHDRADRFALFDPVDSGHAIYTGSSRLSLDGLGLGGIKAVGFGTDSDAVLGVGFEDSGDILDRGGPSIATFDISAAPSLDVLTAWGSGLRRSQSPVDDIEIWAADGDFLVSSSSRREVVVKRVDGESLANFAAGSGTPGASTDRRIAIDHVAGQVFTADDFGVSTRTNLRETAQDPVDEPVDWRLSIRGFYQPGVALGGGVVAGFERQSEKGYLVIASSNFLSGSFGDYHAVVPDRLLDTREAIGVPARRRIGPRETITVEVAGRGGLPVEGVLAVTMNATVTEPTGDGFVKLWPTGVARPEVSNVNYVRGKTVANSVTVTVGGDGDLQIYNHSESATHVLLDITGYYSNGSGEPGARFYREDAPESARRLLDTRSDEFGPKRRVGPGEYIDIEVPPSYVEFTGDAIDAVAAVLNVTAVGGNEFSFLSVYPADLPRRPDTSTLNYYAGDIRSNMVVAALPTNDTIRIYNHSGTVDIVVDLFGHYVEHRATEESPWIVDQTGRYYPTSPYRRFDSRESSPFPGTGAIEPNSLLVLGNSLLWTDIMNVTVTEPTSAGYITMLGWSTNGFLSELPETSNVNFVAGETIPNAVYATGLPLNAIFNPYGRTHVVIDVFGYLTPDYLTRIDDVFDGAAAGRLAAPGTIGATWTRTLDESDTGRRDLALAGL